MMMGHWPHLSNQPAMWEGCGCWIVITRAYVDKRVKKRTPGVHTIKDSTDVHSSFEVIPCPLFAVKKCEYFLLKE